MSPEERKPPHQTASPRPLQSVRRMRLRQQHYSYGFVSLHFPPYFKYAQMIHLAEKFERAIARLQRLRGLSRSVTE